MSSTFHKRFTDARRDIFDAIRSYTKGSGFSHEARTVAQTVLNVPRQVMGLEKGQFPQTGEAEWYFSLVRQQMPLVEQYFRPGGYSLTMATIDAGISLCEWQPPLPSGHYRNHPAFKLAQGLAAMRTYEGRILAKHYFRVALRGIKAGV